MNVLSVLADLNQPGIFQLLDVVRKGGCGYGQIATEVGAGHLLHTGDAAENLKAARVGQRLRNFLELFGVHGTAAFYYPIRNG
jgi:hypothetical protein